MRVTQICAIFPSFNPENGKHQEEKMFLPGSGGDEHSAMKTLSKLSNVTFPCDYFFPT